MSRLDWVYLDKLFSVYSFYIYYSKFDSTIFLPSLMSECSIGDLNNSWDL